MNSENNDSNFCFSLISLSYLIIEEKKTTHSMIDWLGWTDGGGTSRTHKVYHIGGWSFLRFALNPVSRSRGRISPMSASRAAPQTSGSRNRRFPRWRTWRILERVPVKPRVHPSQSMVMISWFPHRKVTRPYLFNWLNCPLAPFPTA